MAWAVTSEIYPSRYRSVCIGLCASSNWIFNFFIGFATPFITSSIGFSYGYLFAGFNFLAVLVVFFFLPETSGRSLEVIDTMFLSKVKPWKSSSWSPPERSLSDADRQRLPRKSRAVNSQNTPEKDTGLFNKEEPATFNTGSVTQAENVGYGRFDVPNNHN